ncbi:mitochondrial thiamine pyrophosphate transporter, variant 2 [Entomophthora muscae]|uniref:Mitochondrial thiamine pyrophosphate transporter, variant 2 n=1 Tax=Entomophthora muscae TaxID=34485 RepID=A0ACC2UHC4_9FUNG|nr:mitochondrial thiamine pyrophosphate transporter, variant 2 [Entomophthora muscae]
MWWRFGSYYKIRCFSARCNKNQVAENTRFCPNSKSRTKALPLKYRGIFGTAKTILREEGLTAFWKGNLSAEYLYIAYSATQFFSYRQINDALESSEIVQNSSIRSFLSGASAGLVATSITYPLDLLRTKFVAQDDKNKLYTGIKQSIDLVIKREGLVGLYKGLSPTLIQIMPAMGIVFFGFDTIKASLDTHLVMHQLLSETYFECPFRQKTSYIAPWKDTIAGALAGLISKTVVFPMDVMRKRFQIQTEKALISPMFHSKNYSEVKGSWAMLKKMIQYEGVMSLYKGIVPGLLKGIPSTAVTFGVYGFCLRCMNPVL